MPKNNGTTKGSAEVDNAGKAPTPAPRSAALAANGIRTGDEFARVMSALVADVLENRVSAQTANAACNAGGKLLQVVTMQHKYGARRTPKGNPRLVLA